MQRVRTFGHMLAKTLKGFALLTKIRRGLALLDTCSPKPRKGSHFWCGFAEGFNFWRRFAKGSQFRGSFAKGSHFGARARQNLERVRTYGARLQRVRTSGEDLQRARTSGGDLQRVRTSWHMPAKTQPEGRTLQIIQTGLFKGSRFCALQNHRSQAHGKGSDFQAEWSQPLP